MSKVTGNCRPIGAIMNTVYTKSALQSTVQSSSDADRSCVQNEILANVYL